ncbi:MAG: homoserine dehydrogenase [Alphaproteobacteria bacterium]|nr:homoserine dehydrogenase [Alphaproteobacteria bacterium]
MTQTLRIGIAGLGTVGIGVVKIFQDHGTSFPKKAGRDIVITAVSARDRKKDRGVCLDSYTWYDDPLAIARADTVDVVVELIGGSAGLPRELVETALQNGKHVVTANKALLAEHGFALACLAEKKNRALCYEAAVAGGIPIIKALREGFVANQISEIRGILNGTCNYILTAMRETGRSFEDILKEAQEKGYAEADPTFDIEGIDAAHKLCILNALAFGINPNFEHIGVVGISAITTDDIKAADELGYRIKLLGVARREGSRTVQRVEPCLVPISSPLGSVEGVFNAVDITGDFVGRGLLVGRGAGEGPTASAVVADLMDIARGNITPVFALPPEFLTDPEPRPHESTETSSSTAPFYVRLTVRDQPGVLASVAGVLYDSNISIGAVMQRARMPGQTVPLILTTHPACPEDLQTACRNLEGLPTVTEKPVLMRIED